MRVSMTPDGIQVIVSAMTLSNSIMSSAHEIHSADWQIAGFKNLIKSPAISG